MSKFVKRLKGFAYLFDIWPDDGEIDTSLIYFSSVRQKFLARLQSMCNVLIRQMEYVKTGKCSLHDQS